MVFTISWGPPELKYCDTVTSRASSCTKDGSDAPARLDDEAGPSKPMVAELSSAKSGKEPRKRGLTPEAFQLELKGLLKIPAGVLKDQWILFSAKHGRKLVRVSVGLDKEPIGGPSFTHCRCRFDGEVIWRLGHTRKGCACEQPKRQKRGSLGKFGQHHSTFWPSNICLAKRGANWL